MAPHRASYRTIDEVVGEEIKRLHERYPKLGHHGLLEALREAGVHVEPEELKRFLKEHGLQAQPSRRPWRWRGLPSWLGGPPESPK
jgi:glutamyl-tRNA reductase